MERRGISFREWLVMRHSQARERGHRRRARAFREALDHATAGNFVRAVNATPAPYRAAAAALAEHAVQARAARRRGRRAA